MNYVRLMVRISPRHKKFVEQDAKKGEESESAIVRHILGHWYETTTLEELEGRKNR